MAAPSSRPSSSDALRLLTEAGALGLAVVELDRIGADDAPAGAGMVRIGVHRGGALPAEGLESFDILLSADPAAPAPWVGAGDRLDEDLAALAEAVRRQPVAATVAAQVHRMTLSLDFGQSLVLESLAYSMLLASDGFKTWRAATPVRVRKGDDGPRVSLTRDAGGLSIRLTRPNARNAVDARMRDALAEALDFAALDPDQAPVTLAGEGPAFCAGGDLDAFGQADDVGRAHAIRVLRFATGRLAAIAGRATARLHGACVGAGIEIPAAAGRVLARPDTVCRLPEVAMGLIPGAGGTASIPRRIGRHRAAYMAVSGAAIDVTTALAWGLVDALDDGP